VRWIEASGRRPSSSRSCSSVRWPSRARGSFEAALFEVAEFGFNAARPVFLLDKASWRPWVKEADGAHGGAEDAAPSNASTVEGRSGRGTWPGYCRETPGVTAE